MHALVVEIAEIQLFKRYNSHYDVFTPPAFTDGPCHQSVQNANFSTSPGSPHFTDQMVQPIDSLHHLKRSIRFYTDLFCLSVNLRPSSTPVQSDTSNTAMESLTYCFDLFP